MVKNKRVMAYIGLFFVLFVWSLSPLFTYELQKFYSPTFKLAFGEFLLFFIYISMSAKHLKEFNISYIKVGIPTGFFLALANVSQKIGLNYTTPAKYAFLENLSCVVVPILMYFMIKKKIRPITVISAVMCLAGVFVLNGVRLDGGWGIGEILCALAGVFYSFNIAGTAVYANKLHAPLFLAVQSVVGFTFNLILSFIFNFTGIEKIVFPLDWKLITLMVLVVAISSGLCWPIRTNALKHISASTVAIIMSFSAFMTAIVSVAFGTDVLSLEMIIGGIAIVIAIILSSFDK
ncbi:MAG: DMT family transporter [Ruminococcaceae bacterium]|nr:DMT family transporter [Oscillospiraceae bacterium]